MSKHQDRMQKEYEDDFREKLGPVPVEVYNMIIEVNDHQFRVQDFIEFGIRTAASKAVSAGYSGAMNDGGAQAFFATVQSWVAGLSGTFPMGLEFSGFAKEMTKKYNPEAWEEYQRLKKLFEGS